MGKLENPLEDVFFSHRQAQTDIISVRQHNEKDFYRDQPFF